MFIIQGLPRTGTNLIKSVLNQHPNIECYGEVFNKAITHKYPASANFLVTLEERNNKTVLELLDIIKQRKRKEEYGFSAHACTGRKNDLSGFDNFWDYIPNDTKIIRVRRNNILRQFISFLTAKRVNQWVVMYRDKSNITHQKIIVKKIQLDNLYKYYILSTEEYIKKFTNTINVTYENLIQNIDYHTKIILDFLEVDSQSFKINWQNITVKTGLIDLKDAIENYNEFIEEIKGTMWEPYLCQD